MNHNCCDTVTKNNVYAVVDEYFQNYKLRDSYSRSELHLYADYHVAGIVRLLIDYAESHYHRSLVLIKMKDEYKGRIENLLNQLKMMIEKGASKFSIRT